ncbi:chemotaxis protein CheW [Oscillatoria sp. FACHB-1406]|uniref:chemotaxis protein CheW n=1 Tax=Oscillatoria sp. FACHB-1406 TaxID=2692846 RepID=UPI001685F7C4|nr:chemotaxis protein CheW [Oscillatoria sp. FACHB-1406]MBD2579530.1 chemotaxis protein CheW [Oscillatoria sp. FACHB-1406]
MSEPLTSDSLSIDRPILNDCWNQIGVMGDRSCGELATVIHCHDCSVFAAAGDRLLEREPPVNYLNEWIDILAETPVDLEGTESDEAIVRTAEAISVMLFGLGNERLALPVKVLQEVTSPCIIQPLPHRSNELFLGLVNIRGETLLCASLCHLLNLESSEETSLTLNAINTKRMMVAGQGDDKWVFPVDEVYGVYRFHLSELRDAPVVISKAAEAYTQGIIYWQGKKVNYLDSELLFYTLNHKIL